MEFRRRNSNDSLQDYGKSLSSNPVEKHSTNSIRSFQPYIPKEFPKSSEILLSYISTITNSESPSVSCILPADKPSQTQATLNADRLNDQLSFPTVSEQLNYQTTTQTDFTCSPGMDKNSKLELQHPDLNVSVILDFLKLHEEKYNFLQEQMSCLLEQKAMPCYPKTALVPTNDNKSIGNLASPQFSPDDAKIGVLDRDTENSKLLACLQAQREKSLKLEVLNQTLQEKVQILQEENRKLQNRNDELINFILNANGNSFNKIDNAHSPQSLDTDSLFNNVAGSVSFEERKKHCTNNIDVQQETVAKTISSSTKASSSDVANIEVRQEKEVEKTSTSTMTSVVYDGNDKVVYKKLTTVTTDFKKQCNELSAHCSMNKEAENTPQHRPSPKCTISQKKRLKCRKCGKCSPHSSGKNKLAHNVSSDTFENECGKYGRTSSPSGIETVCGVLDNTGKQNEVQSTEPKRIVSSKYEKILRNVNKLVLNFEEDESVLRKLKGYKNTPSSRAVDSLPITRKSMQRYSNQRQSSNSSSESINTSPENSVQEAPLKEQKVYDNETASTTISMYGLSSDYLSRATRDYLDNFGLVRDHCRTLKCQTTLPKRYPR